MDEICIEINATNDMYQATHFIREFEVEVTLLQPDRFDTNTTTMTATIEIIEDGMY